MIGYGLTETCGMTSICTTEFAKHGTIGVLGPSTECKLQGKPTSQTLANGQMSLILAM
jgi:long-chain acyl-CoA synthetase